MLPLAFLRSFYMVFIGLFLLIYLANAAVAIVSARVGDAAPTLIGWGLSMLSVLLVAMALEELRRTLPRR